MARGRPPKPEAAAWLAGDPGKRRRYTVEPESTGLPEAPDDLLDPIARAEWDSMVSMLSAMNVLGRVDSRALALYCETYGRYRVACEFVAEHGGYNDKGNPNGATKDIQVCSNQLRAWLVEFGCTPAARARMRVKPASKPKGSKWDGVLKVPR